MIVECKNCGAPLDVAAGSAFARCSYCHNTSKVKSSRTLMAESPPGWMPPPTWQPPQQYKVPHVPLPFTPQAVPRAPEPSGAAGCAVPAGIAVVVAAIAGFGVYSSGVLTNVPFLGVELAGTPSVATIDLTSVPATPLRADASGSYSTSELNTSCRGFIPRTPQFLLRTATAASVRIGARDASTDLVMAVHTSDGQWLCDDDSGGSRMPLVAATLPAGDHRVFVGPYSQGEGAPFSLLLEAQAGGAAAYTSRGAGVLPEATPQIGEVQVGDGPLDGRWRGTTSGWTAASGTRNDCRGYLPSAPHLRIHATEPRDIELITRDNAGVDLVMVVQEPIGTILCDDDSGGEMNPRIRTRLTPGVTNVWVGVFQENATGSFELELDAPSADGPGAEPLHGTVNLDVPGWRARYAGEVSPDVPITSLAASCRGMIGAQHDLVILTSTPRTLTLSARGAPNLRVVLRGPDRQAFCAESERGARPAELRHTFQPGATHVWVGAGSRVAPSYILTLAE